MTNIAAIIRKISNAPKSFLSVIIIGPFRVICNAFLFQVNDKPEGHFFQGKTTELYFFDTELHKRGLDRLGKSLYN